MTFQEFIEKLCDDYPEAVVPFLKNRKYGSWSWSKYTSDEQRWHEWFLNSFPWWKAPEGRSYWSNIAYKNFKTPDLNKQLDEMIELLEKMKV